MLNQRDLADEVASKPKVDAESGVQVTEDGLKVPSVSCVQVKRGRDLSWAATYRRALASLGGQASVQEVFFKLQSELAPRFQDYMPQTPKALRKEMVQTLGISPVKRGSFVLKLTHEQRDAPGWAFVQEQSNDHSDRSRILGVFEMTVFELETLSRATETMVVHPTLGPIYVDQDVEYSATFHLTPIYGGLAAQEISKSRYFALTRKFLLA